MTPRLCVFDLDETLLNREKKITPENERAVLALQQQGVLATIATGRSHLQIREYIDRLQIKIPVITCNGGVMSMPGTEEILHVSYLMPARARKIAAFCEAERLDYLMYTATHICYTAGSRRIEGYLRYNEALRADPARSRDFLVPVRCMDDADDSDFSTAIKLLVLGDAARLSEIAARFNRDHALTIVSSGEGLIDIMAQATTKGDAVAALAKREGISLQEVAVFGDSPNDISMFEVAGVRVAMGNAVPEVRALATYVTKTNEESGVAAALAHLFSADHSA